MRAARDTSRPLNALSPLVRGWGAGGVKVFPYNLLLPFHFLSFSFFSFSSFPLQRRSLLSLPVFSPACKPHPTPNKPLLCPCVLRTHYRDIEIMDIDVFQQRTCQIVSACACLWYVCANSEVASCNLVSWTMLQIGLWRCQVSLSLSVGQKLFSEWDINLPLPPTNHNGGLCNLAALIDWSVYFLVWPDRNLRLQLSNSLQMASQLFEATL